MDLETVSELLHELGNNLAQMQRDIEKLQAQIAPRRKTEPKPTDYGRAKRRIMNKLRREHHRGFSSAQLQRFLRGELKGDEIKKCLGELVDAGEISAAPVKYTGSGRPVGPRYSWPPHAQ